MMRVLIVDDHTLVREGLSNLLTVNGITVVGTAGSGQEALEQVALLQPDVLLMDVDMPGEDGIGATRRIKAKYPQIKIVMVTVVQDDRHLFEALKAGASGYILKSASKEQFIELLTGLEAGEPPFSTGLAGRVVAEFTRREQEHDYNQTLDAKTKGLSSRQVEILKLVAEGLTYKKIAVQLRLSEATIKYHIREISGRLQLENRSQLIAFASQAGLTKKRL
ncbi:MAG: response regulator transcription factor [Bacillota bacterium]|jgi:DNA-binding NarL/FixJ family response regulator